MGYWAQFFNDFLIFGTDSNRIYTTLSICVPEIQISSQNTAATISNKTLIYTFWLFFNKNQIIDQLFKKSIILIFIQKKWNNDKTQGDFARQSSRQVSCPHPCAPVQNRQSDWHEWGVGDSTPYSYGYAYFKISHFLERIPMEHIGMKNSLKS